MTIEAVAMLQTIARDEFERDWNGFDEPFQFIEGAEWNDPPNPPVEKIIVELDGKRYAYRAEAVVHVLKQWHESFQYDVQEEQNERQGEEDWDWTKDLTEEQMEEEAWEKLIKHWTDQLDSAEESLAALQTRLDYVVEGWKELVAYSDMIVRRMPEAEPLITEKLQAAYDEAMEHLQAAIQE